MKKMNPKQKVILVIFGLFLSVVLIDIGLRLGGFIFLSLQEYRNIASIRQRGSYRIMCIGESTTALGGEDAYSRQLEKTLNEREIRIKFSVINKGIPATNTTAILLQLQDNLDKYNPDMVITMMGLNDGIGDLMAYEDISAKKNTQFFKSFRIYKLIKLIRLHIVSKVKKEQIGLKINDAIKQSNCRSIEMMLKEDIKSDPGNDEGYRRLGAFYKEQGKFNKALAMYNRAVALNPNNCEAYIGLGLTYLELRKFDKMEEIYKRAIAVTPRLEEAYRMLGGHYFLQEKFDKAIAMYNKAIEINPESDATLIELGNCYMKQARYASAEEMFRKAIEINPNNDRYYGMLSSYYERQGKNRLSEEYFRKANVLRLGYYNSITRHNYRKLKEIVTQRGIKLVCVQYPVRSIKPLKKMLEPYEDVIFVDNEKLFKEAIRKAGYDEYFNDRLGGDFGHCTRKGNRLLAENIANVILKECFSHYEE